MKTKYKHYILPKKIKFDDTVVTATLVVHKDKRDDLMELLQTNADQAGILKNEYTPSERKDENCAFILTGMSLSLLNVIKKLNYVYLHFYTLTSNDLRIDFSGKDNMAVQLISIKIRNGNYGNGDARYHDMVEVYCDSDFMTGTVTKVSMNWPSIGSVTQEIASKFAYAINIGLILMEDCNKKFVQPATVAIV